MKENIIICFVLLTSLFLIATIDGCRKDSILSVFEVGDGLPTEVFNSEDSIQAIKINSYSYNVPSGVSLSWNGIIGLEGKYRVYMTSYSYQGGFIEFHQDGVPVAKTNSQIEFVFYANGKEINVVTREKSGKYGVRLVFEKLKK